LRRLSAFRRPSRTSRPRPVARTPLRLEALEERSLPSTVTNLNDTGPGSLRSGASTSS
jgi:hypothetical protein